MITLPILVDLQIDESQTEFEFSVENDNEIEFTNDYVINVSVVPIYDGDYEITPGEEAVILQTNGKELTGNITVNPIPSNWGKIGWNGSYLTVT